MLNIFHYFGFHISLIHFQCTNNVSVSVSDVNKIGILWLVLRDGVVSRIRPVNKVVDSERSRNGASPKIDSIARWYNMVEALTLSIHGTEECSSSHDFRRRGECPMEQIECRCGGREEEERDKYKVNLLLWWQLAVCSTVIQCDVIM